jgi:hypothetical protein
MVFFALFLFAVSVADLLKLTKTVSRGWASGEPGRLPERAYIQRFRPYMEGEARENPVK